ncbi:MAG: uridine kinase [Verrucomicrobiae bacterium]|nr:uridine kinase [Verrucomicrobiae bacterium]
MSPITIAIVGGSGAGKTFLADRLKTMLGNRAEIIRLDNFYKDLSHLTPSEREKINFDDPSAIDWDEFRFVFNLIHAGKNAILPHYDFSTHTRKKECSLFTAKPIVIVEGLWLIHEPWLRKLFSFSVFIESPLELRLKRRIARDTSERSRTIESVTAQFNTHVSPMHDLFVEPQKQFADFVLTSPWSEEEWNNFIRKLNSLITTL